MDIDEDAVTELVQSIFQNMLQLSCSLADDPIAVLNNAESLIASIQIDGDWRGAVQIHTSIPFGRKATAAMLMMPDGEVTLSDIQDAIAELSNMVGGGVKGILPGESRLSLPVVASGANLGVRLSKVKNTQSMPFTCEGHAFAIAIQDCNPTD